MRLQFTRLFIYLILKLNMRLIRRNYSKPKFNNLKFNSQKNFLVFLPRCLLLPLAKAKKDNK